MTKLLSIDTSTEACSVGVWRDGRIFTKYIVSPQEHAKRILPMVKECLIDAELSLGDINFLAFGHGPGNFTGIRIALGIAQGLAFGSNLPMIGISSLLTIAQGVYRKLMVKKVLVAMDARMGEIYSACYELHPDGYWRGKETESLLKPEEFLFRINKLTGQWAIAGTGWLSYPVLKMTNLSLLESGIHFSDAQDILILALQEWRKGKTVQAEEAQLVYLRNEVTQKKITHFDACY